MSKYYYYCCLTVGTYLTVIFVIFFKIAFILWTSLQQPPEGAVVRFLDLTLMLNNTHLHQRYLNCALAAGRLDISCQTFPCPAAWNQPPSPGITSLLWQVDSRPSGRCSPCCAYRPNMALTGRSAGSLLLFLSDGLSCSAVSGIFVETSFRGTRPNRSTAPSVRLSSKIWHLTTDGTSHPHFFFPVLLWLSFVIYFWKTNKEESEFCF